VDPFKSFKISKERGRKINPDNENSHFRPIFTPPKREKKIKKRAVR